MSRVIFWLCSSSPANSSRGRNILLWAFTSSVWVVVGSALKTTLNVSLNSALKASWWSSDCGDCGNWWHLITYKQVWIKITHHNSFLLDQDLVQEWIKESIVKVQSKGLSIKPFVRAKCELFWFLNILSMVRVGVGYMLSLHR